MNIELSLMQSIALTLLLLVLGTWAARRVGFLQRFCIPAPVVGGFLFAVAALALRETGVGTVAVDTTLQEPAMLAFFTTVGLGASLRLLKTGGKWLFIYLALCWAVAIFQNLIGIGLAHLLGINPLLGVMAGAVSLEGGHGAAAAFGPTAEALGAQGASAVAIAAATFGLITGSLLGGPLASALIRRRRLPARTKDMTSSGGRGPDAPATGGAASMVARATGTAVEPRVQTSAPTGVTAHGLITLGALMTVIIVGGLALGELFTAMTGYTLPAYVGAMLIAIVVRNLNDRFQLVELDATCIDTVATLTLGFFLTQAMMSLRIWELYSLALPLLIILVVQVIAMVVFTAFIVFRAMGRDYDAAIICGAMIGHGLGGTPNAIANMDAVGRRFGMQSRLGMLIVPLSGAVLIDIVALPWIVFCLNAFA